MSGKPFRYVGFISVFRVNKETMEIEYLDRREWISYAVINVVLPHCLKITILNSLPRNCEKTLDYIDIRW